MARRERVVIPCTAHHVTHRGNRRQPIFIDEGDQEVYLHYLQSYLRAARCELWAFCLMTNHVHLQVVPERKDSLARGVGLTHRRFARRRSP